MDDLVEVANVNILQTTLNAILIQTEDGDEVWLPLSTVEEIHHSDKPFRTTVIVVRWMAEKKGLA